MQNLLIKYLRPFVFSLLAILALSASYFRIFEVYELQTYDLRCQLRGPRPVSNEIILVDIWDDTLKQLGAWPFDRNYHADLIKVLKIAGAKAVLFDILFVEPRDGDAVVTQASKEAQNVYFPIGFSNLTRRNGDFEAKELSAALLPDYAASAKGLGHINPKVDEDGKIRRVYPSIIYQDKKYQHLGLLAAHEGAGVDIDHLPLDEDGLFLINYAGIWEKTFRHVSYFDVIASYLEMQEGRKPRLDLESLRGKYCFIGLTSVGSHDTKAVPIEAIYPMVGMHANVLNSVLNKDYIQRLGRIPNVLVTFLFLVWVLWVVVSFRPMRGLVIVFVSQMIFLAVVTGLFYFKGVWVDLFNPFVTAVVVYAMATLSRVLYEMKKRELIESELKIASQIQKSFLPETLPNEKGLDLAVYMKPAKAVGGDLYTFVALPDRKLGVMVGDVSGKGTPAALFMAKSVSEFKFSARDKTSPSEVLTTFNDAIASEATGGLFVTLSYIIFDMIQRKLVLSDGGHLPVVVVKANGQSELLSSDDGMPIGVAPGVTFGTFERPLQDGDCFALYSDGVSEARNRKKEEYDVKTLEKMMIANRHLSAKEILDNSIADLNQFMGKADQHDDITLIIVKVSAS